MSLFGSSSARGLKQPGEILLSNNVGKGRAFFARPTIGSITLCLLTTLFIMLVANHTLFSRASVYLSSSPIVFAGFAIGVSALLMAALTTVSVKYLTKPALIFFVMVASIASWFNDQFGVIIDKEMIRNAAVTTNAEAGHLITAGFATHVFLTGILPSLLIAWVRISHHPFPKKFVRNMAVIIPCLLVFLAIGFGFSRTFAAVGRQHPDIILTFNPFIPISSAVRYAVGSERERNIVAQPLGTDAHRVRVAGESKPRVTIIVAGETGRAQDFSLGGYARKTNPELEKQNIVYFPNASSCGTATATSIPCMFSVYPRTAYTHRKGLETQNLLDVLTHAKVNVTWWDNDTGSYNVTDRVSYTFLPSSKDTRYCKDGECLDDILLDKLDDWLDHVTGDSVLVLHQLGSHGPAYYLRYPEEYRRFTPDCRAAEFGNCKPEEIVNAYDNTILYTDHIVSTVIEKLKQRSAKISGSAIYLSDHGESLGENGVYLHGAPYVIAPVQQTHIPFLVWVSDDLSKTAGYDMSCLSKRADAPYSHDNLFHSVLGLMDVATKAYDPSLDVFSACRRKPDTLAQLGSGG
jgi:lipid A ethanolaminephosphotransferase